MDIRNLAIRIQLKTELPRKLFKNHMAKYGKGTAREAANAGVGIPNLLGLNALQLLPFLNGQQNQLTLNLNNALGGGSSVASRPVTTYK